MARQEVTLMAAGAAGFRKIVLATNGNLGPFSVS
jgi:hypothetical protein